MALGLWATGALAQQTRFDVMDRRGELLGWEAVGRLDLGGGFCTGTLIARDLVLTAAHCVYDRDTGAPIAAEKITFRAGYHRGQEIAARRIARIAVADGYTPTPGGRSNGQNIGRDVALLKLRSEIFSVEADPFRVIDRVVTGTQVSVVSYGRGREEVLSRQAACALTNRYRDGVLGFDCDVTFGSSGAPVFIREDGRLRILPVVSAISAEEGRKEAFGMVLPPILDALKREMRVADVRPTVSAGARRITIGDRSDSRGGTGAKFVKP